MRAVLFSALALCLAGATAAGTAGGGIAQPVAAAAVRCDVAAYVVDPDPAGLNVRSGPGKASPVVATLKHTDYSVAMRITGATGQWVRIEKAFAEETDEELFKGPGWVYAPMLATQTNDRAALEGGKPSVKIFKGPGRRSGVVTLLPTETEVNIIGCQGGWAQVRYKKFEGWLDPETQCANTLTTCS
ncbi:MAG TPA: SH3 domain-containing protein [Pyrinomonadaceae bacterium]|jgi:SH3-like domain-containing protein|nr:SH3 domain-containing protein [Pyrinomonadaceae bacterium]